MSFSVWHDHEERWDPDSIEEPALTCVAVSPTHAAEKCADDCDQGYGTFIVRDNANGTYRRIELIRTWSVKHNAPTSLAELSEP